MFELASALEGSLQEVANRRPRSESTPPRRIDTGKESPALKLTALMQAIAAFRLDVKIQQIADESIGRSANMMVLNCLRTLYQTISGEDMRKAVELDSPREVATFDRAQREALANLAELRAFVAVITGENDDEELGIEVLPQADWSDCRTNSKSVPLLL